MTTMRSVEEAAIQVLHAATVTGARDGADTMAAAWRTTATEGWHLLAVPESAGGMGGTLADLAGVVRSIAAAGLSSPLTELHAGFVAAVVAGTDPGPAIEGRAGVAMTRGPDALTVPWGRFLTSARVLDRPDLVVAVRPAELTRHTNLAGEPVDELAWPGVSAAAPDHAVADRWRVLHAARLVGAVEATARRTAHYATVREQFGKPISRFQSVAALVAEAHAQAVLARACLDAAVSAIGTGTPAPILVAAALSTAARAAGVTARNAHQVHGAIGITQEMGLERFTRRLWAWRDTWQTEHDLARTVGVLATAGEPFAWAASGPMTAAEDGSA